MEDIKAQVSYEDFERLDIRVGTVLSVKPFPRARNPSYKVEIDLGAIGIRWSSAQITAYSAEELVGTQVCCVVNMPPRNIAGFQSQVLILGAAGDTGAIVLVSPRSRVPDGERLC